VNQPAVEIRSGNQAVPTEIVVAKRNRPSEPIESFAVHAEQNAKTLALAFCKTDQQGSREHNDVDN
jgi:hypothetical protein